MPQELHNRHRTKEIEVLKQVVFLVSFSAGGPTVPSAAAAPAVTASTGSGASPFGSREVRGMLLRDRVVLWIRRKNEGSQKPIRGSFRWNR